MYQRGVKAMRKKIYIFGLILASFLIFIFSSPLPSEAKTDWDCYKKCREWGFTDIYCKVDCSYDEPSLYDYWLRMLINPEKTPKLDRRCFSDCLNLGYSRGYCKQACTYYDK